MFGEAVGAAKNEGGVAVLRNLKAQLVVAAVPGELLRAREQRVTSHCCDEIPTTPATAISHAITRLYELIATGIIRSRGTSGATTRRHRRRLASHP